MRKAGCRPRPSAAAKARNLHRTDNQIIRGLRNWLEGVAGGGEGSDKRGKDLDGRLGDSYQHPIPAQNSSQNFIA